MFPEAPDGDDPGPGVAIGFKRVANDIAECEISITMHAAEADLRAPLYVVIRSIGRSDEIVRSRTQQIFDMLTMGRKTFIRVALEVLVREDFEKQTKCWIGYVRFSFYNEIGEHKVASSIPEMMGMGAPTDA